MEEPWRIHGMCRSNAGRTGVVRRNSGGINRKVRGVSAVLGHSLRILRLRNMTCVCPFPAIRPSSFMHCTLVEVQIAAHGYNLQPDSGKSLQVGFKLLFKPFRLGVFNFQISFIHSHYNSMRRKWYVYSIIQWPTDAPIRKFLSTVVALKLLSE